jgi:hypothetical protein
MPKLISLGCSWTDQNFESNETFGIETWPHVLGKKLGYDVINLGIAGSGNSSIMKQGIDGITKYKPDMICVAWTSHGRLDFWNVKHFLPFNLFLKDIKTYKTKRRPDFYFQMAEDLVQNLIGFGNDKYIPDDFFRNMYVLNTIAETHSIPIYFTSAKKLWDLSYYDWDVCDEEQEENISQPIKKQYQNFLNDWVESSYFGEFDKPKYKDRLIGWPWFEEMGGYTMSTVLTDGQNNKTHRISPTNGHPNQEGHNLIANEFFKKIKI